MKAVIKNCSGIAELVRGKVVDFEVHTRFSQLYKYRFDIDGKKKYWICSPWAIERFMEE